MKERSKQFRTLKEILLNSRDPQQAPLLRKAVERRVLAKARQVIYFTDMIYYYKNYAY